ncbi:unnamed protein product, partial [Amoebophrya sp. A25]|eukprot:GSA25T00010730001.1
MREDDGRAGAREDILRDSKNVKEEHEDDEDHAITPLGLGTTTTKSPMPSAVPPLEQTKHKKASPQGLFPGKHAVGVGKKGDFFNLQKSPRDPYPMIQTTSKSKNKMNGRPGGSRSPREGKGKRKGPDPLSKRGVNTVVHDLLHFQEIKAKATTPTEERARAQSSPYGSPRAQSSPHGSPRAQVSPHGSPRQGNSPLVPSRPASLSPRAVAAVAAGEVPQYWTKPGGIKKG